MKSCQGTPRCSYERSRAAEGHQLRDPWEEGRKPDRVCQYTGIIANLKLSLHAITYREDDRNTSANGLATIQGGSIAHEQVLPAVALPAEHASTEEQNLNRIACRQGCVDTTLLDVDGRLRATHTGRDGTGLVGTVHGGCGMRFVGVDPAVYS